VSEYRRPLREVSVESFSDILGYIAHEGSSSNIDETITSPSRRSFLYLKCIIMVILNEQPLNMAWYCENILIYKE
jgi:hypothetical protein